MRRQLTTAIVLFAIAAATATGIWAVSQNRSKAEDTAAAAAALAQRVQNESRKHQHQSCLLFEGQHLRDVRALRNTYKYLAGLSAAERKTTLNQTVLAGLPQLEAQARIRAPDSCDRRGVGLPEPDPAIPRKPAGLRPATP